MYMYLYRIFTNIIHISYTILYKICELYLWIYRLKKTKYTCIYIIYIHLFSLNPPQHPRDSEKKGPSYTLSSDLGARSQRRNKRRAEAGASGGKACATRKGLELGVGGTCWRKKNAKGNVNWKKKCWYKYLCFFAGREKICDLRQFYDIILSVFFWKWKDENDWGERIMINCFKHDLGNTWKWSIHKDPPKLISSEISLDNKAPHPSSWYCLVSGTPSCFNTPRFLAVDRVNLSSSRWYRLGEMKKQRETVEINQVWSTFPML